MSSRALLAVAALLLWAAAAQAAVEGSGGIYRVRLTTQPEVIPVGRVRLTLSISTDAGPVEGATVRVLVKMPTMDMGEKETVAQPDPANPGTYVTEAAFMMAGPYEARIDIAAITEETQVTIPLRTGQNTGEGGGGFPWPAVAAAALIGLIAFTLYRMRVTGQRVPWQVLGSRGVLGSLLLLAAMTALAVYAVNNWRREGAMTPIEAQVMDMNTPAPPGPAPVTLATVERGAVESAVRYTGQAVAYDEQDVSPRVQGWVTWMPFYVGDRVRHGQVLARLDTSQSAPQVQEREAGVGMARQEVAVAAREAVQARAEVRRAQAEEASKRDAVGAAESEVKAAQEERAGAEAGVAAARAAIPDAEAAVSAAEAAQSYWTQELGRQKTLLDRGVISRSEYEKDAAEAAEASAGVRQARARLAEARAAVQSAQAAQRRAEAMVGVARRKQRQASSEARAAAEAVQAARATADAARSKVGAAEAGVGQARAALAAAGASRGYSEVRALLDGVVTQRLVSPGALANAGQALLRVARVDPIRLQANVAGRDLQRVRVGARVRAHTQQDPSRVVTARIRSVTPAVDPVARTGVAEAIAPNPDGRIRPGQYVVMEIGTARRDNVVRVPSRALRTRTRVGGGPISAGVGHSVWLAETSGGQTTVREVAVEAGASDGTFTEIISGLQEGQQVVIAGAEGLRDGMAVVDTGTGNRQAAVSEARITVSSKGYTPASVTLKAGAPARLTFVRVDEENCGQELVIPDYGIKRALPLNEPVLVEFTPRKGQFTFTCGMDMLRGTLVAQ